MDLNPARSAALAGLTVQAELDLLWLTRQPSRNVFYRGILAPLATGSNWPLFERRPLIQVMQ